MTKRKTFKRLVAGMLAALLCVSGIIPGLGTGAEQAEAADVDLHSKTYNAGGKKLKDYWGATNQDVLSWLGKHINDNYYLGTPYANYHSEANSNTGGSDWRSPTGDVAERDGFPGNDDKAGQAMMNCTGFVWHVIMKAAGMSKTEARNEIPCWGGIGAGPWSDWLRSHNVEYKTYWIDSRVGKYDMDDFVNAVVDDGYISPGDLIWTWAGDVDTSDGIGDKGDLGQSAHVGIYLGGVFDDEAHKTTVNGDAVWRSTGKTQWWQSTYYNRYPDGSSGSVVNKLNGVNRVIAKDDCSCLTVIKFSDSTGELKLKKVSSNAALTNGNGCYTLAGAVYGVYSDSTCKTQVGTLTTTASGESNTITLPAGEYYVNELTPSTGYKLDRKIYPVTVAPEETELLSVKEKPTDDPATIKLLKIDQQTGEGFTQGAASLAGAQFTVKYYAEYYTKDTLPKEATRTWVLETKEVTATDGTVSYAAILDTAYKVSGDEFYISEEGNIAFPLGTISVQETKAPTGYLLDGAYLQAEGSSEKITGMYVSQIRQAGDAAHLTGGNVYSVADTVKRGDLSLIKVENTTQKRLANVAFRITSKTTGESHVFVTDENGTYSTKNSFAAHSSNTNANDQHVEDGEFVAESGIWFGQNSDGESVAVDDKMGALPYDTYTIEELPCKANEGKKLIPAFEVKISRDDYTVELGTLTNDNKTTAIISKTDATTGEQVSGAKLELYKLEGEEWQKIAETVTTDEEWQFVVESGRYKLVETMAPTGYLLAEEVKFTVDDGEVVKRVEMKDEPIEISGNIDKKQTDAKGGDTYYYTLDYCSTSNTFADELNLTDPLESVSAGYTRLESIQTPVSFDDYDGKMNVWYQTNKTDPTDRTDADQYNACKTNPENPGNPDNERITDYTGWKLWKADVSTLESITLPVADLNLSDGEYVTAFRFEHGRVEEGFTTRKNKANDGELDPEKSEADTIEKVVTPHPVTFSLKDAANPELIKEEELHYAPAVLKMQIISDDYQAGKAELVNSAEMNIYRDKGVTEKLKDEDKDRVIQKHTPEEKTPEKETPKKNDTPKEIIRKVQTGLKDHAVWFAALAVVLITLAVVFRLRKDRKAGDGKI